MAEYGTNSSLSNQLLSFKKSITSNNRQTIEKYLSHIKNLPQDFLNQALFWSIQNYKVQQQTDQCLHILLRYTSQNSKIKANPNCQINLQTPLIAACKKAQLSLVRRLIQNGAKPDLPNSQNKYPLEFLLASRNQNYDVAEYLISQMQSVNFLIKNKYPIQIAVEKQYARIFKSLYDKGSQLVFQDGNILHFILKQKFKNSKTKKKMLKQLTTKYVLFNQSDKNGKTPIEYQQNEEIKTYYMQNFKPKKIIEPLLTSNEKPVNNSSSIFINMNAKINKKQAKFSANEKKKVLYESNSLIGKSTKDKEIKGNQKTKDEDVSFDEEIDDKSEGSMEEDDKYPQKSYPYSKVSNLPLTGNKKYVTGTKNLNNSSFISNSSTNNAIKQTSTNLNSSINNNTNKLKSKYSSIGPRTQTNLKNSTGNKKIIAQNNKGQSKRPSNFGNKELNSKKKSSFQDEKRDSGSNRKIFVLEDKGSYALQKEQNQKKKMQKNQKYEVKQLDNNDQIEEESKSHQNLHDEVQALKNSSENMQIEQVVNSQAQKCIQTLQFNEKETQIRLPQKQSTDLIEQSAKKSEWQVVLEKCQKMMQQMIIKEEQQITNLKELKQKFNTIFYQYQKEKSEKSIKSLNTEQQKLKQLKTYNNDPNKVCLSNKSLNSSKELMKDQNSSLTLLTGQLLQIQQQGLRATQKMTKYIREAISFLTQKIQTVLQAGRKEKIDVSIEVYGSRANGLQIQTSDTDLLIICNINAGVKDLMMELERGGAFNCPQINQAKFLYHTSMPITKLSLNENFMHMNIDLTFQIRGHTGLRCTALIKQFIATQELLKPLVLVLKNLLNCYGLCDTYTGGLGSYSLTLMTIALLQFTEIKRCRQNLGEVFLEFLLFYGFQMDYVCQAIIIHPPGFNQRPAFSIYQLPYSLDLTPKLIIYDPLNPVNNVGRATYRLVQLKKLFKIWYVKLRTQFSGRKDGIQQLMKIKNELLLKTSIPN